MKWLAGGFQGIHEYHLFWLNEVAVKSWCSPDGLLSASRYPKPILSVCSLLSWVEWPVLTVWATHQFLRQIWKPAQIIHLFVWLSPQREDKELLKLLYVFSWAYAIAINTCDFSPSSQFLQKSTIPPPLSC